MTKSENALDRIMNKRVRPTVPPRGDIIDESRHKDTETSTSLDIKTSRHKDVKKPMSLETETDLPLDTQIDLLVKKPQVTRSTIRIEESIYTDIRHLCTDQKITKEVWIEAAFLYLSSHPEAMETVNDMARERLQHRKEIADLRRAQTMKDRLQRRLSSEES